MLTSYPALTGLLSVLLLSSCSFTQSTKKQAAKPIEPVTGLHALYQMYTPARMWAQDLQILRYSSLDLSEVPRKPGKAAAWQVVFVSPSLAKARPWTFSVYEASVTL